MSFFQKEIEFLGHKVSERGIAPDDSKIEKIRDFPTPRNAKEVKSFLGLSGYYRRFIKAQATGQKRPDIGQLSWPVTVPVNGMLRQFPGAGNLFFSIEKNFWERQYSILRTPSHYSVALPPELSGHTNDSLSTFFICP